MEDKRVKDVKKSVPFGIQVVHYLSYWPIYMLYGVFVGTKILCTWLQKLIIPLFVVALIWLNGVISRLTGSDTLWTIRYIFTNKQEWYEILRLEKQDGIFTVIVFSIAQIVLLLIIYVIPAAFVAKTITATAEALYNQFAWLDVEDLFVNIVQKLQAKTNEQYSENGKDFVGKKMLVLICNIVCLILLIIFLVAIVKWLGV